MTVNRFGYDFLIPDDTIYFDSASLGRVPSLSFDVLSSYYHALCGLNSRGTHKAAICAEKALRESRLKISSFFNVPPSLLSFLPSTETGLLNYLYSQKWNKGDRFITSLLEEHSLIAPLIRASRSFDCSVDYLSLTDEPDLAERLNQLIVPSTRVVCLSALTLGLGIKRDWQSLTKVCKDNNVDFILSLDQAVGHYPIHFDDIMPDMVLSSGSVGALGPLGSAFQILSSKLSLSLDPILVGSGSIARMEQDNYVLSNHSAKYETGILDIASIQALAKSIEILSSIGLETIEHHEKLLHSQLRSGLTNMSSTRLLDVEDVQHGPILSFYSSSFDIHDTAIILEDLKNIIVRSGGLCAQLLLNQLNVDGMIQLSTHLYNTEEEVKIFFETLEELN